MAKKRKKRRGEYDINYNDLWGSLAKKAMRSTYEKRKARQREKRRVERINKEFSTQWSLNPVSTAKSYLESRRLRRLAKLGGSHLKNYAKLSNDTKTLARLARKSPRLAKMVADNPNTSKSQLMAIAKSKDPKVKASLLASKNIPSDVVWKARTKENMTVVLAHPNCPPDKLKTGFFTSYDHKLAILNNPNCPASELAKINKKNLHEVMALANNKNATAEQLAEIAKIHSSNRAVLAVLGRNRNVDKALMDKMVAEGNKSFLSRALEWADSSIIEKFRRTRDNDLRVAIAQNPNCQDEYQKALCRLNDPNIDLALSQNPNLNLGVQNTLVSTVDQNDEVLENILRNTTDGDIVGSIIEKDQSFAVDYLTMAGVQVGRSEHLRFAHQLHGEYLTAMDWKGGRCANCGRPISGKHGRYGDKCRRGIRGR